jgi:hypothetical protein
MRRLMFAAALLAGAAAPARAGLAVGQAVVAEWQDGAYYAGTVKTIDGKRVEIAWSDGSDPTTVAAEEVLAVPKKEPRALAAGALALCAYGTGARWHDCRIKKVTAHGAAVAYLDGEAGDVGWDGVIVPTGRCAKELAERAAHH